MQVAIMTMFGKLDATYSLVNVVAEQLRMLLDAGHKVRLLVCEGFEQQSKFGIYLDPRIQWREVCNTINGQQIEWRDYDEPDPQVHDTFFDEAKVIAQDLVHHLADVQVCILHDMLYQGWHLLHNVALRMAQEKLPKLRFLSFAHSAPVRRPPNPKWPGSARFIPMPRTTFISLTYAGIAPLAAQYDVPEGHCRVVYNSLDLPAGLGEHAAKLARQCDLLSPHVLMVYPGRLTPAKHFDKLALLAGTIKEVGETSVKVVFCDFPSGDINPNLYKGVVRLAGEKAGLTADEMVFTSEQGCPEGFPRSGVLDLFTLSNLFVHPSFSEAFPLIALEAASRGNLLVVNQAVPSLEEIGRQLGAHFMRWDALANGYQTTETYLPSEQAYYREHAETILAMLRENPVIAAKTLVRQRYGPAWVWKNQLGPLIEGE